MIKENVVIKSDNSVFVTRICDECGKEEKARMGVISYGRKTRKSDIDLCRKCCKLRKYAPCPIGDKSKSWRGGRRLYKNGVRLYDGIGGKYIYEHRKVMEEKLGKKLDKIDIIHHIDMNTANNHIDNLYLFYGENHHRKCHSIMEDLAFTLLRKNIWFDHKTKEYVLYPVKNNKLKIDENKLPKYKLCIYIRKTKYRGPQRYEYYSMRREDGSYAKLYKHDVVAEITLGRKLYRNEVVHHIDGNPSNNDPNNLVILVAASHTSLHKNLQRLMAKLYIDGIVKFKDGNYYV